MPAKPRNQHSGRTRMKDPVLQKAQTSLILAKRLTGASEKELAAEFRMHPSSIQNRLEWAKAHGLVEEAQELVLKELVPLALEAFRNLLADGDQNAAKDVLFGTGILQKTVTPRVTEDLTLSVWREQKAYEQLRATEGVIHEPPIELASGDSPQVGDGDGEGHPEAREGADPAPLADEGAGDSQ